MRRPADAQAYKQRTLAEAQRDQARFEAEAEAYRKKTMAAAEAESVKVQVDGTAYAERATADAQAQAVKARADGAAYAERATAEAQAEANKVRAASLRDGNQELIAASHLVDALPQIVEAAARGISGSNLTILNGTEGVGQMVTGLVGQGLSILDTLKKSTAVTLNGPGRLPRSPDDESLPTPAAGADT